MRYLSERHWTMLVVLYLCLVYPPSIISKLAASDEFLKGDCYYYRATIISLLNDHDLLIANNVNADPLNGQLAIGKDGFVPKHPIIMPLVSTPFYMLLGDPGLLLFNIFDCIILAVLIFKLNRLFFNPIVSFVTTILYGTGTLFLDYVFNYSSDVLSTVLVLGGLYFVLCRRYYVGAILLGFSVFAKVTNAPLAGMILLCAGFVVPMEAAEYGTKERVLDKLKVTAKAGSVFVVALAPFLVTNLLLFGSPFVTGYQKTAEASPINGLVVSINHVGKFNQPLLQGIYQLLFAPIKGIVPTNPVLILGLLGMFLLNKSKDKKSLVLIAALCIVQLIFFAKYDEWYASHFSNRFLMTFIALFSIFTSNYLDHLRAECFD